MIFPTETVYGIGADALDAGAAEKIYAAKGRPSDNPLIIHLAEPEDAEKYAYTTELYYKIANRFMPGPITFILPKKNCIPDAVTGGLDTVAIRIPVERHAHRLIELAECRLRLRPRTSPGGRALHRRNIAVMIWTVG